MASSPSTSRSSTGANNPLAEDSVWGWQQNADSFGELGKFLFENYYLSDVVLHCGVSAAVHIKAHKFILAARSPIFEEMFFGDQKSSDAMHVIYMDEDKAVLEILLKLMYGFDHSLLLTIHNVSHIIQAAEKYKVHVAISSCERWIVANMNATTCLSWLEASQQFPPGVSRNATAETCWHFIDQSAVDVIRSPKFLEVDHILLVEILKRNTLRVDEYAVYEAALRWACQRCYLSNAPSDTRRAALGEALYQIRFTLMSAKEFGEGPAQSGILVPEEVSSILLYMVTDKKLPIKFVTEPRIGLARGTSQVESLPAADGERVSESPTRGIRVSATGQAGKSPVKRNLDLEDEPAEEVPKGQRRKTRSTTKQETQPPAKKAKKIHKKETASTSKLGAGEETESPEGMCAVDAVLGMLTASDGKPFYLVKWYKYPLTESTWEDGQAMAQSQTEINEFQRRYGKPSKKNNWKVLSLEGIEFEKAMAGKE